MWEVRVGEVFLGVFVTPSLVPRPLCACRGGSGNEAWKPHAVAVMHPPLVCDGLPCVTSPVHLEDPTLLEIAELLDAEGPNQKYTVMLVR